MHIFPLFDISKKTSESLRLWGDKLTFLQLMKVTAFCTQKWSSNRAAKLPRDVTLVADYIVILVCFFSTTFTTRRAVGNANFGLVTIHFSVFERDSLRHAECNQNFCNQRDIIIGSSLGRHFSVVKFKLWAAKTRIFCPLTLFAFGNFEKYI